MIRALVFDLDNTLVDRDAALRRWLNECVADPQLRAKVLARDCSGYGDRDQFARWLRDRVPGLGVESPSDVAAGIAQRIEPDPDAVAAVGRLRSRFAIGVATNGGSRSQRFKLARSGLENAVDAFVVSQEVGVAKPHPSIFRHILDLLGCRAAEAVYIGDHPECDVAGAARAGLATCWVSRERNTAILRARPDWVIDRVRPDAGAIASWLSLGTTSRC